MSGSWCCLLSSLRGWASLRRENTERVSLHLTLGSESGTRTQYRAFWPRKASQIMRFFWGVGEAGGGAVFSGACLE